MRFGLGPILSRIISVIVILLVVGIVLQLVVAILSPVLPVQFRHDLGSGWDLVYGMVSPVMAPIMAFAIICALCWIFTGGRR